MAERSAAMSEYVACLRRIRSAHGSPSLWRIARRTRGTYFPLSWYTVGEYLRGDVLPGTSLMFESLLDAIIGDSSSPADDEDRELAFRLWAAAGEPDEQPGETTGAGLPAIMELTVQVATYLGAAGIGGIIGNRADSVVVQTTSRLFQSVRDRWQSRTADADEPLSEEEAVDAAIAAAIALAYNLETLQVTAAEQQPDGSWRVILNAHGDVLRAFIPAGDPANATILIVQG